MYKYIKCTESNNSIMEFDINVDIVPKYTDEEIESSIYKGFTIPDGEVIPETKCDRFSDEIEADYAAFVESVEDLLTEYYGFELYYENKQGQHSKYFSFLAKEKETGKIYLKFRLRLRVSNHDAHRTDASQSHKKEETETEKYKELTKNAPRVPRPYTKNILVNSTMFNSYEEAFIDVDEKIEKWIEVMKK